LGYIHIYNCIIYWYVFAEADMAELGKVFKGPLDGCNEDEDSLVPTKWSFAAIPTVSGDRDEWGNLKAQIASAKVSSVCQKLGKDPCDIGSTDGHGMTRQSL
jgi:hypothetical protein